MEVSEHEHVSFNLKVLHKCNDCKQLYLLFKGTLKKFLHGDASCNCFNRKVASAASSMNRSMPQQTCPSPNPAAARLPQVLQVLLVALFTCNKENNKN